MLFVALIALTSVVAPSGKIQSLNGKYCLTCYQGRLYSLNVRVCAAKEDQKLTTATDQPDRQWPSLRPFGSESDT